MKQNKKNFVIWTSSLLTLISLNLIAQLVINHQGSIFFMDKWWSTWFPIYLVLFSFIAMSGNHGENNDN